MSLRNTIFHKTKKKRITSYKLSDDYQLVIATNNNNSLFKLSSLFNLSSFPIN